MRNIFYSFFGFILFLNQTLASEHPFIPKLGLPGDDTTTRTVFDTTGSYFISIFIKYVAVIAVISLMLAGIMYLISGGEEEKVKKAKTWVLWSVIGVIISISAWGLVNIINNIYINN